jgi:hypothetical protein
VPPSATLETWWREQARSTSGVEPSVDRALAGGALADRLAYAFAAGYQAALASMFGGAPGELASFCVTEQGGGHPKAMATTLAWHDGTLLVEGVKTWATMAPLARTLYVVAVAGAAEGERRPLRVVRVGASAAGVALEARPPMPIAPEIPHARLRLEAVALAPDAALEGDGYERYVRPFRTVEDVHVTAAVTAYLAGAGARRGWPESLRETLCGLGVSLRGLASLDPSAPATHVALAGALTAAGRAFDECAEAWQADPDEEAARWARDRPLLAIADAVRQKRREAAWRAAGGP